MNPLMTPIGIIIFLLYLCQLSNIEKAKQRKYRTENVYEKKTTGK